MRSSAGTSVGELTGSSCGASGESGSGLTPPQGESRLEMTFRGLRPASSECPYARIEDSLNEFSPLRLQLILDEWKLVEAFELPSSHGSPDR